MEYIKETFESFTEDQKKFGTIGLFILALLVIYAISKNSDSMEQIIVEPTQKSFKGGDLVSNNAADYYRNKGVNMAKQYEDVKSSQKIMEDQIKEIKIALEQQNLEREKRLAMQTKTTADSQQQINAYLGQDIAGKKINR